MHVSRRFILIALALLWLGPAVHADQPAAASERIYIGTYGESGSKGIYVAHFDPASGQLSEPHLAIALERPSFLAVHPDQQFLYAVTENYDHGTVTALAIHPDDSLTVLNQQPSGGKGPCYISLDPSGRVALLPNYGSGSYATFPIAADGTLLDRASLMQDVGHSVNPSRQEAPHAHSINPDPTGHFAFGCDLGTDHVQIFKLDAEHATLTPNDPASVTVPPGSGPRHLAFHPNGRLVYVINEIASTIAAFSFDPSTGSMTALQTISTLPEDFHGTNYSAEIQVHPSGKFLYGSNRGDDSLALFTIDQATGKLTPRGQIKTNGKTPRGFRFDPTGHWLLVANQDSNKIQVFRVDTDTGELTATSNVSAPSACCIRFVTASK